MGVGLPELDGITVLYQSFSNHFNVSLYFPKPYVSAAHRNSLD